MLMPLFASLPETANIFKSAKQPLLLTFKTTTNSDYSVLFKHGDDIRQDQLVIQLFQLMERLLRKENLDLQLTPYKVLATGANQGLLEFINALPLATILAEYNNDLGAFLRKHNPDPSSEHGIHPTVMDTYVKSCGNFLFSFSFSLFVFLSSISIGVHFQRGTVSSLTSWASATDTWTTCCCQPPGTCFTLTLASFLGRTPSSSHLP